MIHYGKRVTQTEARLMKTDRAALQTFVSFAFVRGQHQWLCQPRRVAPNLSCNDMIRNELMLVLVQKDVNKTVNKKV